MAAAAVAAAGSSSNSSRCICVNADVLAVPAIDAAVDVVVAAVAAVGALVVLLLLLLRLLLRLLLQVLLLMLLLLLPMRTGCVDHSIPAYILAPPACVGSAFSRAFVYRLVSITIVAAVSCKHT